MLEYLTDPVGLFTDVHVMELFALGGCLVRSPACATSLGPVHCYCLSPTQ